MYIDPKTHYRYYRSYIGHPCFIPDKEPGTKEYNVAFYKKLCNMEDDDTELTEDMLSESTVKKTAVWTGESVDKIRNQLLGRE